MQQMIFEKCRCLRDPEIKILIIPPNCDASQFKKWDKLRKKVLRPKFFELSTSTSIANRVLRPFSDLDLLVVEKQRSKYSAVLML